MRIFERNAMTLIQIGVLSLVVLVLAMKVVRPILTRPIPALTIAGAIGDPGSIVGDASIANASLSATALPQPNQPGLPAPDGAADLPLPDGDALRHAIAERPEQTVTMLQEWLAAPERMMTAHWTQWICL